MIIMGYPGVGKTFAAKDDYRFIDLDSHEWKDIGKDWAKHYCRLAENLSKQGYFVLVSTHPEVKNRLSVSREKVCLCYPSPYLKDQWIQRLYNRYQNLKNARTHNAWKRVSEHFDEDVAYMRGLQMREIVLTGMSYNLKQLIVNLYDAPIW